MSTRIFVILTIAALIVPPAAGGPAPRAEPPTQLARDVDGNFDNVLRDAIASEPVLRDALTTLLAPKLGEWKVTGTSMETLVGNALTSTPVHGPGAGSGDRSVHPCALADLAYTTSVTLTGPIDLGGAHICVGRGGTLRFDQAVVNATGANFTLIDGGTLRISRSSLEGASVLTYNESGLIVELSSMKNASVWYLNESAIDITGSRIESTKMRSPSTFGDGAGGSFYYYPVGPAHLSIDGSDLFNETQVSIAPGSIATVTSSTFVLNLDAAPLDIHGSISVTDSTFFANSVGMRVEVTDETVAGTEIHGNNFDLDIGCAVEAAANPEAVGLIDATGNWWNGVPNVDGECAAGQVDSGGHASTAFAQAPPSERAVHVTVYDEVTQWTPPPSLAGPTFFRNSQLALSEIDLDLAGHLLATTSSTTLSLSDAHLESGRLAAGGSLTLDAVSLQGTWVVAYESLDADLVTGNGLLACLPPSFAGDPAPVPCSASRLDMEGAFLCAICAATLADSRIPLAAEAFGSLALEDSTITGMLLTAFSVGTVTVSRVRLTGPHYSMISALDAKPVTLDAVGVYGAGIGVFSVLGSLAMTGSTIRYGGIGILNGGSAVTIGTSNIDRSGGFAAATTRICVEGTCTGSTTATASFVDAPTRGPFQSSLASSAPVSNDAPAPLIAPVDITSATMWTGARAVSAPTLVRSGAELRIERAAVTMSAPIIVRPGGTIIVADSTFAAAEPGRTGTLGILVLGGTANLVGLETLDQLAIQGTEATLTARLSRSSGNFELIDSTAILEGNVFLRNLTLQREWSQDRPATLHGNYFGPEGSVQVLGWPSATLHQNVFRPGGTHLTEKGPSLTRSSGAMGTFDATANWWGQTCAVGQPCPGVQLTTDDYVDVLPSLTGSPRAAFFAPLPPTVETGSITFADKSFNGDDAIVSRLWSFGDGTSVAEGTDVTHAFEAPGTYDVTLRVLADDGVTSIATQSITVEPILLGPTTGSRAAPATFESQASETMAAPVTHTWSFGDGSTATGPIASHTFATLGTQTVTLTATNGVVVVERTHEIQIENLPPTVTATASHERVSPGVPVVFTATAEDPDGTPLALSWDLGDGSTAEGGSVEHVYTQLGAVIVMVKATDADGAHAFHQLVLQVSDNVPPLAGFTADVRSDARVSFTDTSVDPDGRIVAWSWTFTPRQSSTQRNPSLRIVDAGLHDVELVVTDDRGATARRNALVEVDDVMRAQLVAHPATLGDPVLVSLEGTWLNWTGVNADYTLNVTWQPGSGLSAYSWSYSGKLGPTGRLDREITFPEADLLPPGRYLLHLQLLTREGYGGNLEFAEASTIAEVTL